MFIDLIANVLHSILLPPSGVSQTDLPREPGAEQFLFSDRYEAWLSHATDTDSRWYYERHSPVS